MKVGVGGDNPQPNIQFEVESEGSEYVMYLASNTRTTSLAFVKGNGDSGFINVNATGSYKIDDEVAFSSVPIGHVSGFNSTLGAGTTFQAFIPDSAITLKRITVTVVSAGVGGTGDIFFCEDGSDNEISVTVAAAAAPGTVTTAVGSSNVAKDQTVNFRMESDAGTTPTVNVSCEYLMQ